jgi:hypothetical protein
MDPLRITALHQLLYQKYKVYVIQNNSVVSKLEMAFSLILALTKQRLQHIAGVVKAQLDSHLNKKKSIFNQIKDK